MTILSTNYSQALLALFENARPPISAVEVGPWYNVTQIEKFRHTLPELPFHFHASSMLTSKLRAAKAIAAIKNFHDHVPSPWVTPHIDLLPPSYLHIYRRFKISLPIPNAKLMIRRLIKRVQRLAAQIDIPVVLENLPSLPGSEFQSNPAVIGQILEETGCNLLLDTGHARIAASIQQMDIQDYLEQLPLNKVVHLHVSGPRLKEGRLTDAHEALEDVDYALLEWLMENTNPRIVNLEYFRESTALGEQLHRLARLI